MIRTLCLALLALTTTQTHGETPRADQDTEPTQYAVMVRVLQVEGLPTDGPNAPDLSVTMAAATRPVLANTSITVGGGPNQPTSTGTSRVPISFAHPKAHVVIGGEIDIDLADTVADPRVTALSAPRLLIVREQEAIVTVGAPVRYLTRDDAGCLHETEGDAFEGMTLRVTAGPDETNPDRIHVQRFALELSEIASREPVVDVSLDVGRPIIRTTRLDTSFTIADGVTAVAPLYMMGLRADGIVALLSIKRIDESAGQ